MCKRRRDCCSSYARSGKSPLPCISGVKSEANSSHSPATEEQMKEWGGARCPVCMEHPHNAVLLICSSYVKGCRPYMCDTSQRHSNCLDQFCKSFAEASNATALEEGESLAGSSDVLTVPTNAQEEGKTPAPSNFPSMHKLKQKLVCPLCRGQISGWIVVQADREFMNAKTRSCACETCNFTGNYRDLRKHARVEHPQVRPSEVDPERQQNWRQLERQRDIGDMLSIIRSSLGLGEENYEEVDVREDDVQEDPQARLQNLGQQNQRQPERQAMLSINRSSPGQDDENINVVVPLRQNGLLTMFLLFEVWLEPSARRRSSRWLGTSRRRLRLHRQDINEAHVRYVEYESSSGDSVSRGGHRRRVRRRLSTPEDEI